MLSFDVDADGILNVTAKDKNTGKSQSIRIEASSTLSDDEVKRLQEEAEKNAEIDAKKKEIAESKYNIDRVISEGDKIISQRGMEKDAIKEVSDEIDKLKEAKDSDDQEKMNNASASALSVFEKHRKKDVNDEDKNKYAEEQEEEGGEDDNK